mmetsp:Transcript_1744/g.4096  ORF Transcript_1744/g.4096 Transcript_1744/m.4096 type:complete len:259 (-) Transcript_1744:89-865(-)
MMTTSTLAGSSLRSAPMYFTAARLSAMSTNVSINLVTTPSSLYLSSLTSKKIRSSLTSLLRLSACSRSLTSLPTNLPLSLELTCTRKSCRKILTPSTTLSTTGSTMASTALALPSLRKPTTRLFMRSGRRLMMLRLFFPSSGTSLEMALASLRLTFVFSSPQFASMRSTLPISSASAAFLKRARTSSSTPKRSCRCLAFLRRSRLMMLRPTTPAVTRISIRSASSQSPLSSLILTRSSLSAGMMSTTTPPTIARRNFL